MDLLLKTNYCYSLMKKVDPIGQRLTPIDLWKLTNHTFFMDGKVQFSDGSMIPPHGFHVMS